MTRIKNNAQIEFRDEESGKDYQFITNIFRIAASSIAEIYKQR